MAGSSPSCPALCTPVRQPRSTEAEATASLPRSTPTTRSRRTLRRRRRPGHPPEAFWPRATARAPSPSTAWA